MLQIKLIYLWKMTPPELGLFKHMLGAGGGLVGGDI